MSDSSSASRSYEPEQLISVSVPFLILSTTPLLLIAYISWRLELELASPIIVSGIRAFVQLSILGYILNPIFAYGIDYWFIVAAYVCFMVTLASREAANRVKYVFKGMGPSLLGALLINITVVGLWAFGVIIKPTPFWNPQYIIPICGMLLGNSINGLALSLNAMLTSLVEQQREIELYLSFGATGFEACNRLVRQAIRAGTTPTINGMAVIGLISIPGMMTGQILGGAPVVDAARYQMLIMYLIATCVFGSSLMLLYVAVSVGFDRTHMLRIDRIRQRTKKASLFDCWTETSRLFFCCCCDRAVESDGSTLGAKAAAFSPEGGETEALSSKNTNNRSTHSYDSTDSSLKVVTLRHTASPGSKSSLEIRGIKRSVPIDERNRMPNAPRRVLFSNMDLKIGCGEIAAVRGVSGSGKSQLLRVIAGLSPAEEGELDLGSIGLRRHPGTDWTIWRRNVRYVTQFKVDNPGTPRGFAERVASFKSQKTAEDAPTLEEMLQSAGDLVEKWGLGRESLDKDWTFLSGGEAQRVILALALASRPRVVLLDESTSALDMDSKLQVEHNIQEFAAQADVGVLLVTHDQDQLDRFQGHYS
mmetsp:Transcript_5174/g.11249  ORF Transcript_5174/g.11249 Transcript_5174/m.11249 type:complete len:590 (+) Transcript_5174:118-1887(+)